MTRVSSKLRSMMKRHVEELCPGLPAWEALMDCAQVFTSAETIPMGRLVDYPADWGTPGADRMTGLALPFKAIPAGSEGALIAELRSSTEQKSPLLITFWQPHWAMSAYDVQFVDLPVGEDACFNDPAWGPNPASVTTHISEAKRHARGVIIIQCCGFIRIRARFIKGLRRAFK